MAVLPLQQRVEWGEKQSMKWREGHTGSPTVGSRGPRPALTREVVLAPVNPAYVEISTIATAACGPTVVRASYYDITADGRDEEEAKKILDRRWQTRQKLERTARSELSR